MRTALKRQLSHTLLLHLQLPPACLHRDPVATSASARRPRAGPARPFHGPAGSDIVLDRWSCAATRGRQFAGGGVTANPSTVLVGPSASIGGTTSMPTAMPTRGRPGSAGSRPTIDQSLPGDVDHKEDAADLTQGRHRIELPEPAQWPRHESVHQVDRSHRRSEPREAGIGTIAIRLPLRVPSRALGERVCVLSDPSRAGRGSSSTSLLSGCIGRVDQAVSWVCVSKKVRLVVDAVACPHGCGLRPHGCGCFDA